MGIFINLKIARSVTKEEWQDVYEESLKMAKAFPLAEKRTEIINGIKTICLVKTEEREEDLGWDGEKIIGWNAVGDYDFMNTAEEYYLPRNLVKDKKYIEKCEDVLFSILPLYLDYDWEDKRFDFTYHMWGAKTQGEPYHLYLLAIACMIEYRLGTKAIVYGDITKGQCIKAVEMANKVLDDPIDIPDRCDMERLLNRVKKLPLTENEKISVFEGFYLGNKNAEFGDVFRSYFSKRTLNIYWKKRFAVFDVSQYGFQKVFSDYLLWGFDLAKVCKFVKFEDKDGNLHYEDFVRNVMDAKLYLKEKDCSDPLSIDQDEENPYSIYTLLAQFALAGLKNKSVNRYIPIDEIRKSLIKDIGDKCDVNGIIDDYLKEEYDQNDSRLSAKSSESEFMDTEEGDSTEILKQYMNKTWIQFKKNKEEYDVTEYEELLYYKNGKKILPSIIESIGKSFVFCTKALEEERYKELMNKTPYDRCRFLIEQNRYILIRDKDWKKIFEDIEKEANSFSRYYPLVRVRIHDDLIYMVKAIMINDDLYRLCLELAEKYKSDNKEQTI